MSVWTNCGHHLSDQELAPTHNKLCVFCLQVRVAQLETALRKMHSTVHRNQVRVTIRGSDLDHFGPKMLGEVNLIAKDALGRDDECLRYIEFPATSYEQIHE